MSAWELVALFVISGLLEYRLRAIEHQAKQSNDSLVDIAASLRAIENQSLVMECRFDSRAKRELGIE